MATTAVGNPYVESSDLVANYPGASEALAERIDIVGVNPFADSAARATAIPSPTEGMMSSLNDTNAVERYDGATWKPVGGKVLQVVSVIKTDTFSTTTTSFTNVTGASVTITPSATSSKVLIMGNIPLSYNPVGIGQSAFVRVNGGNSSTFVGDAAGNRIRALDWSGRNSSSNNPAESSMQLPLLFLDSPNTTSAVTYNIQVRVGSVGTVYIGRAGSDSDTVDNGRFPTSIIVMEVAA